MSGGRYIEDANGRRRPDLSDEPTAERVNKGIIQVDAEGYVIENAFEMPPQHWQRLAEPEPAPETITEPPAVLSPGRRRKSVGDEGSTEGTGGAS